MTVGLEGQARVSSHPLAIVALVMSAVGFTLSLGGVGALILDLIPRYVSFGLWFYLVFFSALGLLAALLGIVLGLASWLPARRDHRPRPRARLAVVLGALAIAVQAATLLASQVLLG